MINVKLTEPLLFAPVNYTDANGARYNVVYMAEEGYWNKDKQIPRLSFREQAYLHNIGMRAYGVFETKDVNKWYFKGFWKLTDIKKELLKSSGMKYSESLYRYALKDVKTWDMDATYASNRL